MARFDSHGGEPGLRLLERQARLETSDGSRQNPVAAFGRSKRFSAESGSSPYLHVPGNRRSGMAESGRKNTHNRIRIVVEPEAAADNLRICAIGAPPQAIADHRYRSKTERDVLRTK